MILTGELKIVGIEKKTQAKFFKDLNVGDKLKLQYNLNGSYHSAPTIDIYKDGQRVHSNNANQLVKNLSNFEIAVIYED